MAEESFSDRSVVLCRPGDPRLGLVWELHDDTGGFEQAHDGPVMLVITGRTPDEKCEQLAKRFGVPVDRLIAFRNSDGMEEANG
jgi:hypothetical protein